MESNKIKKSKISWFGNVPFDWEEYQIKHLFDIGRGRVISILDMKDEGKYPVFSSQTLNNGIMGYVDTYDFDGEYLTWTTDGVYAGTIFKRKGKFNCTNICGTLKVKDNRKINIDFAKYSLEYVTEYCKRPDTNGAKIMNNEMAVIKIYLPNLNEQHKIADFLDSKCQKIDDTIEKINKQIEVLKKYKQSLITEVVTKGLDKNAPMKDSGVEWIGKIPKRWEVKRLKYTINSIVKGNGITKEEVIEDGDTPCVRYGELYTKYNHSFDKCVSYTNKDIIEIKQYFYKDSILFTCTGELIEEIGKSIVYKGNEECLAGGDILVVATSENAEFINYVSNSYAQIQKSIGKAKLKVVHISAFDISNLLIAIPTIDEQNKIVEFLNLKCAKIGNILDKKLKQIEILEQYKKSLIYEYVTGKKRV